MCRLMKDALPHKARNKSSMVLLGCGNIMDIQGKIHVKQICNSTYPSFSKLRGTDKIQISQHDHLIHQTSKIASENVSMRLKYLHLTSKIYTNEIKWN